mmetsp:Transcript_72960/g.188201  ORF Transcript_72960/g.188201 Transcript_72960/m.188201 type:complete len:208 (-) Transcript_72960:46-669(-)
MRPCLHGLGMASASHITPAPQGTKRPFLRMRIGVYSVFSKSLNAGFSVCSAAGGARWTPTVLRVMPWLAAIDLACHWRRPAYARPGSAGASTNLQTMECRRGPHWRTLSRGGCHRGYGRPNWMQSNVCSVAELLSSIWGWRPRQGAKQGGAQGPKRKKPRLSTPRAPAPSAFGGATVLSQRLSQQGLRRPRREPTTSGAGPLHAALR